MFCTARMLTLFQIPFPFKLKYSTIRTILHAVASPFRSVIIEQLTNSAFLVCFWTWRCYVSSLIFLRLWVSCQARRQHTSSSVSVCKWQQKGVCAEQVGVTLFSVPACYQHPPLLLEEGTIPQLRAQLASCWARQLSDGGAKHSSGVCVIITTEHNHLCCQDGIAFHMWDKMHAHYHMCAHSSSRRSVASQAIGDVSRRWRRGRIFQWSRTSSSGRVDNYILSSNYLREGCWTTAVWVLCR